MMEQNRVKGEPDNKEFLGEKNQFIVTRKHHFVYYQKPHFLT